MSKVTVTLGAYTNIGSYLEHEVLVPFNKDEKKIESKAIELGKKHWGQFSDLMIKNIHVEFIDYDKTNN